MSKNKYRIHSLSGSDPVLEKLGPWFSEMTGSWSRSSESGSDTLSRDDNRNGNSGGNDDGDSDRYGNLQ